MAALAKCNVKSNHLQISNAAWLGRSKADVVTMRIAFEPANESTLASVYVNDTCSLLYTVFLYILVGS